MPRVATLLAAFLVACAALAAWALLDPGVPLLVDRGGARWIRVPEPFSPILRRPGHRRRYFRKSFEVSAAEVPGRFSIRAFREATLSIDESIVSGTSSSNWKQEQHYVLPADLGVGVHRMAVIVENDDAQTALQVRGLELGLSTDASWEASLDGRRWVPAQPVDEPVVLPIWEKAPSVADAFRKTLPWQALVFLFGIVAHLGLRSWSRAKSLATPSTLRWVLCAAFAALAVNNLTKIPLGQGFDVRDHVAYVVSIVGKGRLPWADEGWQMFQPPLFYLFGAVLTPLLERLEMPLEQSLRVLPLLCGGLQIEIAYRVMRWSFPSDARLQCIGLLVSAALPVNLYMSQVVGNEPMFGALSAGVVLASIRMLETRPTRWKSFALLGFLLGLACLAKATGLLLVPLVALVLLALGRRTTSDRPRPAIAWLATFGTALATAGWFYARNWHHYGKPVIGGWDGEIGIAWWQDPSYRVPEQLVRFGFSLHTPIFAAVRGFWDALYSSLWADGTSSGIIGYPPWNYAAMLTTVWLALPVTVAIVAGICLPVPSESVAARRVAVAALLTFLLALLVLFLTVPIYTTIKASYTLGIGPCYGILAAAGMRPLSTSAIGRCVLAGFLTVFAVFVFRAYFVL